MALKKWQVRSRKLYVHSPYRKIEDVEYLMPDSSIKTYPLKKEGLCVSILAVTPKNKIILGRQYRPGPDIILDELPAGRVEIGETTEAAALRELLEETGYTPKVIKPLGRVYECAYSTVERYAFLAEGCIKTQGQSLDRHEYIEVIEKNIQEFVDQLNNGLCTDLEVGWMGLYNLGLFKLK